MFNIISFIYRFYIIANVLLIKRYIEYMSKKIMIKKEIIKIVLKKI